MSNSGIKPVPTLERVKELFDYRGDGLYWKKTFSKAVQGDRAGLIDMFGYRLVGVDGEIYKEHKLVWLWHTGTYPKYLDHVNGDRSDNRLGNLRECTSSQNSQNRARASNNTTGFKGVYFDKATQKFRARIYINGQRKGLGYFLTGEEAAQAYAAAAKEVYGEFAKA